MNMDQMDKIVEYFMFQGSKKLFKLMKLLGYPQTAMNLHPSDTIAFLKLLRHILDKDGKSFKNFPEEKINEELEKRAKLLLRYGAIKIIVRLSGSENPKILKNTLKFANSLLQIHARATQENLLEDFELLNDDRNQFFLNLNKKFKIFIQQEKRMKLFSPEEQKL